MAGGGGGILPLALGAPAAGAVSSPRYCAPLNVVIAQPGKQSRSQRFPGRARTPLVRPPDLWHRERLRPAPDGAIDTNYRRPEHVEPVRCSTTAMIIYGNRGRELHRQPGLPVQHGRQSGPGNSITVVATDIRPTLSPRILLPNATVRLRWTRSRPARRWCSATRRPTRRR